MGFAIIGWKILRRNFCPFWVKGYCSSTMRKTCASMEFNGIPLWALKITISPLAGSYIDNLLSPTKKVLTKPVRLAHAHVKQVFLYLKMWVIFNSLSIPDNNGCKFLEMQVTSIQQNKLSSQSSRASFSNADNTITTYIWLSAWMFQKQYMQNNTRCLLHMAAGLPVNESV